MMDRVWVNGVRQVRVSAHDRGLQFGDGLFETMAVIGGEIRHLDLHISRLQLGCLRLGIPCPPRSLLVEECTAVARGPALRAVLKLIVTRGVGVRGYQCQTDLEPTRILSLHDWPHHPTHWRETGVAVRWCEIPLARQLRLAGLKHLNRLEQVLARREWADPDIAEGLMCDADGYVIGGTKSNVFVVYGKELRTPRVDRCGVAGTMRAAVMRLAEEAGLRVVESELGTGDFERADEIFLTNALIGVWPVCRVEARQFAVGQITRRLQGLVAVSSRLTSVSCRASASTIISSLQSVLPARP